MEIKNIHLAKSYEKFSEKSISAFICVYVNRQRILYIH